MTLSLSTLSGYHLRSGNLILQTSYGIYLPEYKRKKLFQEWASTYNISQHQLVYCMLFWNYILSFLMKDLYLFLLSFVGIYLSQMWIRLYWRSDRWFQVLYKLMVKAGIVTKIILSQRWLNRKEFVLRLLLSAERKTGAVGSGGGKGKKNGKIWQVMCKWVWWDVVFDCVWHSSETSISLPEYS